jgi:hypothetical protein
MSQVIQTEASNITYQEGGHNEVNISAKEQSFSQQPVDIQNGINMKTEEEDSIDEAPDQNVALRFNKKYCKI